MSDIFDQLPGYKEAVERERESRDFVLMGLPYGICGVDIRVLTLGDLLALMAMRHSYIAGGFIRRTDVATFLWFLSPRYVQPDSARGWFYNHKVKRARARFIRMVRKLDFSKARHEIHEYLDLCFLDAPGSDGVGRAPTTSWLATATHVIASRYGWTRSEIRSIPLPEFYQLLRKITTADDSTTLLFNRWSDPIKDQFLNDLNAMSEEEREARVAELNRAVS